MLTATKFISFDKIVSPVAGIGLPSGKGGDRLAAFVVAASSTGKRNADEKLCKRGHALKVLTMAIRSCLGGKKWLSRYLLSNSFDPNPR